MSKIFDMKERIFDMSFQEKSNLAMTLIFALVYGSYFYTVIPPALDTGGSVEAVKGLLLGAVIFLVAGGIVGHILIVMLAPNEPDTADERDKFIEMRADARTSYILGFCAITAVGMALFEANPFWIAHVLLGGLVIGEIAKGVLRAVDYRQGV